MAPREIVHLNSWDKLIDHLDNSWIILSQDPHKYLANGQVYDPVVTLSHSFSLSVLPTPHSFPFSIKDVSCF